MWAEIETKEPFGVRKFKDAGFLITNDEKLFSDTIMQLHERGIKFKPSDAGDFKYCIVSLDRA